LNSKKSKYNAFVNYEEENGMKKLNRVNQVLNKRMKLDEAFEEYISVVGIIKKFKPRTIDEHKKHFAYFKNFLQENGFTITYVDELTITICAQYWSYMNNKVKWGDHSKIKDKLKNQVKGLSSTTIKLRTRTLKAQFNYYLERKYILENPWDSFNLKHDDPKPRYWSKAEVVKLITSINTDTFEGERNRGLFTFMLDTGSRISEALALNEWDIDLEEGLVYFPKEITKNGKHRTSPLNRGTVAMLRGLFNRNAKIIDRSSQGAFLTKEGKRITYAGVRDVLKCISEKVSIENATLHKFRHTFAAHYTLDGGDEASLMQAGGWSSHESVKRYRELKTEDLKRQHQRFSPGNYIAN
jgi:integrase/recombinase XerD